MPPLQPNLRTSECFFVAVLFLLFATCLVNLNGGDWDGTQIALGSFFPEAARAGYIGLYNRPWQPLTYAILQFTHRVTGSPEIAMFLPAFFGSAGIGLILLTMSRLSRSCLSPAILAGIILLIPEFLFGSIYMNSTVLGLPFAALAMWLVCPDWTSATESRHALARNLLAGLSLALAALCRFDFALALPLFVLLAARGPSGMRWRNVVALGLGGAIVLLLACATDMMGPSALLEQFARHRSALAPAGRFHCSLSDKLAFGMVGVSPIAWLTAAAAAAALLVRAVRQRRWIILPVIGAVAILLYPLLSTTTPKYLLPFDLFLAAFLAWSLSEIASPKILNHPAFAAALAAAVLLTCFLPARLTTRPPFVRPTMNAALPTDDGPRAFFGYAHTLRHQSNRLGPPDWLKVQLADSQDLLLTAPFDGWLAGSLSQRVIMHLTRNCRESSIGPGVFVGRRADRRIVVAEPARIQESLAEHFTSQGREPTQVAMPHGFTPPEVRLLRIFAAGEATEDELRQQARLDDGAFTTALARLRWAEVLETTERGAFRLIYRIRIPESAPNPDQ